MYSCLQHLYSTETVGVSSESVLTVQASSSYPRLALASSAVCLHMVLWGGGWAYGGLVLPHHTHASSGLVELGQEESTWFSSLTPLGLMLGTLASIPASERLGRKKLLLFSNLVNLASFLSLSLATSFTVLMLARLIGCIGLGLGGMTAIVYLNEIGIVALRGPLVGASQTSIYLGLLAYTALSTIIPVQYLSLAMASNSFLVFLLLLLIPESPQWLLRRGMEDKARASLLLLRGPGYMGVEAEMSEVKHCLKASEALGSDQTLTQSLGARTFSRPLATFTVIFFLVGCSGSDTLVFYGPSIFSQLNVGISPGLLASLPCIGYTLGYALSTPLTAR